MAKSLILCSPNANPIMNTDPIHRAKVNPSLETNKQTANPIWDLDIKAYIFVEIMVD